MKQRILIVDDDKDLSELLTTALLKRGYDATHRTNPAEALELLEREEFALAVVDLFMEGIDGIELCRQITEKRPETLVILMTAWGSIETVIAAIRAGAYDFLTKPIEIDQLALATERAIRHLSLQKEVRALREAVTAARHYDAMIGDSAAIRDIFELLNRVADTEATVLITGESGTGKELVARALHNRGRRRDGPFVAINCAALPEQLLESELFGHLEGAFTDARNARAGLFLTASGGTLFLDEIGDMPLAMQAKLLRSLERRTVRPVGGNNEIAFDTRVVVATNRDLEKDVEASRFREDLYYRINVVRVHVPPLRNRDRDVLLLAQHFTTKFARQNDKHVVGLSRGAAERLLNYTWPGNVRELQNCIERAVALARFEELMVDDLPEKVRDPATSRVIIDSDDPSEMLTMDEVERRYILRVLEAVDGNKSRAAQVLGFDRKTLYRKLEAFGVKPKATKPEGAEPGSGDS